MRHFPFVQRTALSLALGVMSCTGAAYAGDGSPAITRPPPLAQFGFALRPPDKGTVRFHGVVSREAGVGQASSMVYAIPAGAGLAGLIVAAVTHGALAEAARQGAISKEQEAADAVLVPYRDALANFSHQDLMQRALDQLSYSGSKQLLSSHASDASGWTVESTPIFSMTQDQSALVLDNAIVISNAALPDSVFRTVVRVVSDAHQDAPAIWLSNNGQSLKDECVQLFAHSLHLLLKSAAVTADANVDAPNRTFRYLEGKTQKTERAQLVEHACDRAVIKTLRDRLMSIPQPRLPGEEKASKEASVAHAICKTAPRYPS